jgi:hypothetical protein
VTGEFSKSIQADHEEGGGGDGAALRTMRSVQVQVAYSKGAKGGLALGTCMDRDKCSAAPEELPVMRRTRPSSRWAMGEGSIDIIWRRTRSALSYCSMRR